MNGKDELLECLAVAEILTKHNPCKLSNIAMSSLAGAFRALLSREYAGGLSQDRVAEYMGVSTRTLQRWQRQHEDFPKPRHDGFKKEAYDPVEVVTWREQHKKNVIEY